VAASSRVEQHPVIQRRRTQRDGPTVGSWRRERAVSATAVEQNGQNLRMGREGLYSGWVGVSQPGSVDAGWCSPCGLVGSVLNLHLCSA
jgi:hypothetical protein